jgi:P-type Ca2+ transporter type 2C
VSLWSKFFMPSAQTQPTLSVSHPPSDWHSLDIAAVASHLKGDCTAGLSAQEVQRRQAEYGPNELTESGGRGSWAIFIDQFKNIMLLMLILVAVISGGLDLRAQNFPKDAIAIFAIVVLNGILGYLQESRAEKALAALKRMSSPRVRVIRDGKDAEVEASELVPGDLMLLEAGVQVAADGRLVEESNLQIREAALTGEAEAVNKQSKALLALDADLGDRINCVFQGTEVLQGRGTVLVTNTGMQTELGRIATMLQSVESEPTPLQQRMGQLGNVLVLGALCLVVLVVVGGVIKQGDFSTVEELLKVSLSMAVAVVPEGLAAVITVTLALGTQRMVKRQALIRKLPAVETLGSVTTICSDKTGTLTQNKMVVQAVQTLDSLFQVTGDGYMPSGEFLKEKRSIDSAQFPDELIAILSACVLCNDAVLQAEDGQWSILGDPTEGALLTVAGKASIEKSTLGQQFPRVADIPFSSERKRMSVICASNQAYLLFSKGSPELVLERCSHVQLGDRIYALTPEQHQRVLDQNNEFASKGLRILGFATTEILTLPDDADLESLEQNLTWLGLVGMLDAPRLEVRSAVARCRQAGIRPVMITGDHQLTAQVIAHNLGISQPGDEVLSGKILDTLTLDELDKKVEHVSVYARVSPEHKLRIVKALQRRHQFVAMTGDGVNDAPALKQADIGIAMGITGTDVSKEASDMVLLDDNFATIVAATEEGRVVYDNIRRFIKYILGSNIGEVLTIAAAPLIGLGGVPLSPLQILWMNLVTDGLPALALAVEPAEPNVMERSPYDPKESIFARGLGLYMIRIGIILAVLTITMMVWAYSHSHAPGYTGDPDSWKTMVFTTLCLAQMGHAVAVRSDSQLTIQLNPLSNPYLFWAVLLTSALQLTLIYVPPLRDFFGLHTLSMLELSICFGFSLLMFVWIELEKLFIRFKRKHS